MKSEDMDKIIDAAAGAFAHSEVVTAHAVYEWRETGCAYETHETLVCVCRCASTALRVAKKFGRSVVRPVRVVRVGGSVFGPAALVPPSPDDLAEESRLDAVNAAKSAGLTNDQIAAIARGVR